MSKCVRRAGKRDGPIHTSPKSFEPVGKISFVIYWRMVFTLPRKIPFNAKDMNGPVLFPQVFVDKEQGALSHSQGHKLKSDLAYGLGVLGIGESFDPKLRIYNRAFPVKGVCVVILVQNVLQFLAVRHYNTLIYVQPFTKLFKCHSSIQLGIFSSGATPGASWGTTNGSGFCSRAHSQKVVYTLPPEFYGIPQAFSCAFVN